MIRLMICARAALWALVLGLFGPIAAAASGAGGLTHASGGRIVTLAPTRPGNYRYWTVSRAGSSGIATLGPDGKTAKIELAPDTQEVQVLDEADRTLAVFSAAGLADGATLTVSPGDFTRVRLLVAKVTARDGKPVAAAVVTLKDLLGNHAQRVLTAQDEGRAQFGNVPIGSATLTAAYGVNGPTATRTVTVAPSAGGRPAEVLLTLTGKVPAIEAAASPARGEGVKPDLVLPEASRKTDSAAPTERPGPDWVSGVIGIAILVALGFLGLRAGRARGLTIAGTLRKMGAEMSPDAAAGAIAPPRSSSLSAASSVPLASLSDLPSASPAAATSGTAALGTGAPRLVGLAGPVAGAVISLETGTVSIGRDAGNALALTEDNTISRRHARVETRLGGDFVVVDEGSSNGTYVNGVRTGERILHPGDEIQIGSARFRFER